MADTYLEPGQFNTSPAPDNSNIQGNALVPNIGPGSIPASAPIQDAPTTPSGLPSISSANTKPTIPEVITSDSLTPAKVVDLPQPSPTPTPTPVNQADAILKNINVEDTQVQKDARSTSTDIYNLVAGLSGESAMLADERTKAGVDKLKKDYQDISSQITAAGAELDQELAQLKLKPMSSTAKASYEQSIRAAKGAEIGMLNARAQAIKGNYDLAVETAQNAVDLKYKPIKENIAIKQAQLEALKPILDEDGKKQADERQLRLQLELKKIDDQAETEKSIQALALSASQFGADASTIAKIGKSKTLLEAINAAGKYTSDPLDRALKGANLEKIRAEIAKTKSEIVVPTVAGSSNDIVTRLLNSAKNTKELDATERQSLSKARTVVGQLDALQANIQKQNKTGFIKGKVNNLMSKFGQNADVGVINAQLQAVVPNLARGTYGEVGVLTDNDIENYRKTLPQLTMPKDQNDAVMALTLKTVLNSMENTLTGAANSGINVSGWAQDYQSIKNQINAIESRIGIDKAAVDSFYSANANLQPMIKELYAAGKTDTEVLQALGLK